MKKQLIIIIAFIALCLAAVAANAAEYLVSEPYPAGAVQPTKFIVTLRGEQPAESPAYALPDGSVQLRFEVTGLPRPLVGTAKAANGFGESTAVPFGPPAAPAGLGLGQ